MEEEQQSEGAGSYEACRERLKTLHQMREWILKDFSSRKGEVYDFTKPDDEIQNELFAQRFCDTMRDVGYAKISIPSTHVEEALSTGLEQWYQFFERDSSLKSKCSSPNFYDLGNNTQIGWMDEQPQLLSIRRASNISFPWLTEQENESKEMIDETEQKETNNIQEEGEKEPIEGTSTGDAPRFDETRQDPTKGSSIPAPPSTPPPLYRHITPAPPKPPSLAERKEWKEDTKIPYIAPMQTPNPTQLERASLTIFDMLEDIAILVMGFIGKDLGLPPSSFIDLFCEPYNRCLQGSFSASVLLVNYFDEAENIVGRGEQDGFGPTAMGAHTDRGLITVAPRPTHPGLQAFNMNTCAWDLAESTDDAITDFIIFVGDTVQHITAKYYRALLHRVEAGLDWRGHRISIPYQLRGRHHSILDPVALESPVVGPVHPISRIYQYPVVMQRFLKRPPPLPYLIIDEAVEEKEKRDAASRAFDILNEKEKEKEQEL